MEDLRELLAKLGCGDVATYIQSGNAVFRYKDDAAKLPELIATEIDSCFGFRPSVMVLTADEFDAVAKANPFIAEASEPKFLHVWFVREPTTRANTTRMSELESGGEKFLLTDTAVYLYAPDGVGRSKLAAGMEKCLGVPATARNWRTVCKIGEMVSGLNLL